VAEVSYPNNISLIWASKEKNLAKSKFRADLSRCALEHDSMIISFQSINLFLVNAAKT